MERYIFNLTLEITRRCNMKCAHCLRGGAQRINMPSEIAQTALRRFDRIGTITFTGGEPLLNAREIINTLQYARWNGIEIESFYIVTNGTIFHEDLMDELYYLYDASMDKEICCISISQDMYHDEFQRESIWRNTQKYEMFPFFYLQDKRMENSRYRMSDVIPEGRGKNISYDSPITKEDILKCDRRLRLRSIYSNQEEYDGNLYINALGDIVGCPNLSYVSQKKFKMGRYDRIPEFLASCDKTEDFEDYTKENT